MYVETFSTAFTSLPLVMFSLIHDSFIFMQYKCILLHFSKVDEAASLTFFISIYTIRITLPKQLYIDTAILAEQSLHHNIILEKLDHC